jgi:hypothetical protein
MRIMLFVWKGTETKRIERVVIVGARMNTRHFNSYWKVGQRSLK